MERVVTINLNGNPYQLEEPAYDALRAYLTRAEGSLADNPDKAEIVRDLEQAVADKCAAYLSPSKSVVTVAEMTKILEEMGPVEGGAEALQGESAGAGATRKRLYRIRDDARIAGVCAGIGAFFDIDANIIRLLFILGAIFTSGALLLVYVAMMFLIPSAHTSEEWAAAHGVPFNAQEVIDRAKREYQEFAANGPPWTWPRWQRRKWKRAMRARWRTWRGRYRDWHPYAGAPTPPPAGPVSYLGRTIAGLFAIAFGIVRAVLAIVFLALLFTIVVNGSLGYWPLPASMHVWQAIVGLIIIYALVLIPIRLVSRILTGAFGGYDSWGYRHGGEGLAALVFFGLAAWFAYTYIPEARDVLLHIPDALRAFAEGLRAIINGGADGVRSLLGPT